MLEALEKTLLIENSNINRLAIKIWRRHLLDPNDDTRAGRYADRFVSRLIIKALRAAKGDDSWVGDDFEKVFFKAYNAARMDACQAVNGYNKLSLHQIIDLIILDIDYYVENGVWQLKEEKAA